MTIPPGPCPVPGCVPYILNVDKHLKGHKDLTQAQFERRRNRAKRDAAMAALERLRASNPQPAMVSRLDLQSEDPGEGPSQPRTCRRCRDLLKKNRDLEAQVTVLKARVRLYKRKLQRKPRPSSSTRPQQPQPQPPSSSSSSSSPEEEEPIRPLLITSSPEEEEPTRPQQPQPQLQPQPTSSSSSEPTRPQQPQPAPEEPTRPQQPQLQPQPTSSSSEPTRPQQPQPAPEEPTRPQQPQPQLQPQPTSSSEPTRPQQPQPAPEEPTRPQQPQLQPQPTSSSSSEPTRPQQPQPAPEEPTRPQQPQLQPQPTSSSSSEPTRPQQPQPAPEEPTRPQQPQPTSSSSSSEPTRPQQPQPAPEEPTRPQQLQPQPAPSSSEEEEPTRPLQPQPQPTSPSSEPTRPQQPQPQPTSSSEEEEPIRPLLITSSSEEEEPTRPQQQQPQPTSPSSEPTRPQQPQPQPTSSSEEEEPTRPQQPQPPSSSSASSSSASSSSASSSTASSSSSSSSPEEGEPTSPQQQQQQQQSERLSSAKRRLTFPKETHSAEAPQIKKAKAKHVSSPEEDLEESEAETHSAEAPQKKKAKAKHVSSPEEDLEESEAEKNPLNEKQRVLLKAIAPYFRGRSRGSKLKDVLLGTSLDSYVQDYADFVFCPEGTQKMKENAVSKASRAKIFLKFLQLGWSSINYWTWEFLFNIPLIKIYPRILRKVGLAPTTVILYVGQAISFLEFFRSTPPKHSRVTGGQTTLVTRELRKLHRDLGRTVLGHQALVKQGKGLKLIAREDLARCQALARAKMPSLLEDIEKAAPRDPRTRYRFYGYLAAYLTSIYGHRTGVLTRMRVKEVKEAIGDDERGYLINVMEHKTVRKFGTAQLYLNAEEHAWFRTWLRLRSRAVPKNPYFFSSLGRGEAKDLVRYFRMAWAEMGLKGAPSFMDIRTAVSTYNFESNDKEVRHNLSSFMCHSASTQERFYALHKNLKRAKQIRDLFVCLALKDDKTAAPAAAPPAAAGPGEVEGDSKAEKPKKMTAAIKKIVKTVKVKVTPKVSQFAPKRPKLRQSIPIHSKASRVTPSIPVHPKVSQVTKHQIPSRPKSMQVDPRVPGRPQKHPKSQYHPNSPQSIPGCPPKVSSQFAPKRPNYAKSIPIHSKGPELPKVSQFPQSIPSYTKASQVDPKYASRPKSAPGGPKKYPKSQYPNSPQSIPGYPQSIPIRSKASKLRQSIPIRPRRPESGQSIPFAPQVIPGYPKVCRNAPKCPVVRVPTTESPPNGPLRSDDRFARQDRYGPPPEFPLASPCPGIVHHLSGPIARAHAPPPRRCGRDGPVVRPAPRGRDPTSAGARRPSLSLRHGVSDAPSDSRAR
ncbi:hypothetical protein D9C73_027872 [Collichthys lucidus]|uniref:Proteoglycan 4 n=1 Tax=Collichthys lucidus TaxID=240159 RepID=A0A4U5TWW8_COLLU|nr:hypothetical protein D9C73_027872 [Collichthys lucidus]